MAKDLETINREFCKENYLYYEPPEPPDGEEKPDKPEQDSRRRSHGASIISNILFYGCLALMLIGVFIYSQSASGGVNLLGYRLLEPLTTSMQSVYPQGSLIVVKTGNLEDIEVGDDISFMISTTSTATHRCIEVIDNYENNGMTAYRTKGVDNPSPDSGVVYANNVIGKVVWSVPHLGAIMTFIAGNFIYIFIGTAALILLSFGVKVLWGESQEGREKRKAIKALQKEKAAAAKKPVSRKETAGRRRS